MKETENNICKYYKDLDTNFKSACKLCDKEYSHTELLNLLLKGNIPEKQIAALKFDYVKDINDANALLNNLTGCDGKIREAVAQKINYVLLNDKTSRLIFSKISADIFADATIDINSNICRLVIDSACLLKNYDNFSQEYIAKIIKYTNEAFSEINKFTFRDKKYLINKQIFKLYWCLEAIIEFYNFIDNNTLKNIIENSIHQTEYTIREKAASIIAKTNKFPHIKEKLLNDENYYVRQALNHPSFL